MKKKISILGSTGSIGLNTLSIIDKKRHFFNIILLSSNKNYKLICKQIKNYKPEYYVIKDFKTFKKVKKNLKNLKPKFLIFLNLKIKNLNQK